MAKYKYSSKVGENRAKAVGVSLPISTKQAIEICNMIRGMNVQKAKQLLDEVISQKTPVPFKRFCGDVGHKKGSIGAGRFPVKACSEIKVMIESAETNAQFKGLNTGFLALHHISAQKAAGAWHYGRWRRRKQKRTHIEVIVEEKVEKKKDKKEEKDKDETKPPEPSKEPEVKK